MDRSPWEGARSQGAALTGARRGGSPLTRRLWFGPVGSTERSEIDGDALGQVLHRLAAQTRADDAALARRRASGLARQAEEEATLGSVLLDLADRERPIVVQTTPGRSHRGWIHAVGADFVVLRDGDRADIMVHFGVVASVRTHGGDVAVGDRPFTVGTALVSLVQSIAPLRPRVIAQSGTAPAVQGELRWAGKDVAAIRTHAGPVAYVALGTLTEITLCDRVVR